MPAKVDPNAAAELYRVGAEEFKRRQYDEAIGHFTQALEKDPAFFRALVYRGMARFEKNGVEDSIADFKAAIKLDGNYSKAHNGLGNALRKKGHLVEAFQCYKKAVRLEPRQALYHHNLGITACDMALYDIAVLELEMAAVADPASSDIRFDLGSAYYLKKDFGQAIRAFETFLELDPDNDRAPEIGAKIKSLRHKLEEQAARGGDAKSKSKPKLKPQKTDKPGT